MSEDKINKYGPYYHGLSLRITEYMDELEKIMSESDFEELKAQINEFLFTMSNKDAKQFKNLWQMILCARILYKSKPTEERLQHLINQKVEMREFLKIACDSLEYYYIYKIGQIGLSFINLLKEKYKIIEITSPLYIYKKII